jgi:hypothetical protein
MSVATGFHCAWCSVPLLDTDHAKKHVAEKCDKAPWKNAVLAAVAAKDSAYAERNQVVALLLRMALRLGWRAGVGRHEDRPGEAWEPDWRQLVSVDLPTGQASWHFHDSEAHLLAGLPEYGAGWDGHDTPEKYRRVNAALSARPTYNHTRGDSSETPCPQCAAAPKETPCP